MSLTLKNAREFILYNIMKKPKLIKWDEFFRIENREMAMLQIIPDREIDNGQVENIIKAFTDLYEPMIKRIEIDGISIRYKAKDHMNYRILFKKDFIGFYITVPASRKGYFINKIKAAWSKAAIVEMDQAAKIELFRFYKKQTAACELRLKEHNIFSLKSDRRDNDPYTALLPVIKDIGPGEKLLIDIDMSYYNRADWLAIAKDSFDQFRSGKLPRRFRLDKKLLVYSCLSLLEGAAVEFQDLMQEIWSGSADSDREQKIEREVREMRAEHPGKLISDSSRKKLTAPVLETNITILSQSKDQERAKQNLVSAAVAYRSLDGNNEFEKVELTRKAQLKRIDQIAQLRPRRKIMDKDLLSVDEVIKLVSMPTAGLQSEYKEIEQINVREMKISPLVLDNRGIPLAEAEFKKELLKIYLPTKNYDELCLPVCVIGGMGSGKTKGFTANTALESFRKGFSCIVIDPAKGESCNEIRDALTDEELHRCIDLDFNNVDYPIAVHWQEAIRYGNRLAGEALATMLMDFISDNTDEAGNRTRRYFRNVAKAIFKDPDNTILEIALLLESQSFRNETKKKVTGIARDAIEVLDQMSSNARIMIAEPILNRLDELMANAAIKCCLAQRPKLDEKGDPLLDFRKLMDGQEGPFEKGAYMVLIRASKEALGGKEVRDTLLSYINSKIMLATMTRNDPGREYRPCIIFYDEPHQYMGSVKVWEDLCVEARKYRVKFVFLFHSWMQLEKKSKEFVRALKGALPHYIIYSTSQDELMAMKDIIAPYTVEEAAKVKTHHAIIKLRAGNQYLEPFIGRMIKPPGMRYPVRDNREHTLYCSKLYGAWWEDVEKDIYDREKVLFKK